ncbi:MAG TPA: AraC family transcriptional regulator [Puia sp.]
MGQDHSHMVIDNLLYSCVDKAQRGNEQFVPDHTLGYIMAGETHFMHPDGVKVFGAGTIGFVKRNQLIKSIKVPPPGGEFKAINIFFSQDILRNYSAERNIQSTGAGRHPVENFLILSPDPFLKGYFDSLLPYFTEPGRMNEALTELKTIEAIELVLKIDPSLKDLLFDFSEPYKIDLEAFMQQHYMYNVSMSDFAKLTGRSLASFKRDFEKIFNASPGQWLQQKRLQEAYYLIKEKGIKPSAAYLDVGFENLSHFSSSFKKTFGVAPSLI